ncbi:hypothetical protein PPGU19_093890 (plasmid) [Paraburkholderia sp. PGU19]|nr:hypothetical protein PPGU19_093890 [Paraburkholderia sp. PGU19]
MLPACASHAMLYCKRLSDIAAGAPAAASRPLAASEASTPAAIDLSANAPLRPAVKDSPDLTHVQTRSVKDAVKRPIPAPRFRGE